VLVEALPAGVLVIDAVGTVLALNERTAALAGRDRTDLVGRSVLDLVDPETSWAYAAATAMAADYPDVLMGPLRVTLVTPDGEHRHADLWAHNRLEDPEVGGIVCLLTADTTAVGLAESVGAVARQEPFDAVAALVARALGGHPVDAACVVLREVDDDLVVVASTAGAAVTAAVVPSAEPDDEQPWHAAARSRVRSLHETLDALPPALAEAARDDGYGALWCEPVPGPGGVGDEDVTGVVVAWRDHPGLPSPNELASLFQGAAILAQAAVAAAAAGTAPTDDAG
jgi:PAS domain-containing protein